MFGSRPHSQLAGFTLIEVLIGAFILMIVSLGVYSAFVTVAKTVQASRLKTDAMMLANEQIEWVRNLPYADIGIKNGVPAGTIPRTQTFVRDGFPFLVTASIRNVDDPFDGVLGSSTNNDLAPADYKLVQFDFSCATCPQNLFSTSTVTTTVAPSGLEVSSGNGSLMINVFDSVGDPVSGATVKITNFTGTSTIDIDEVTNDNGVFQLVDTPPGNLAYNVSVSKNGYSTDRTIAASTANPNPLKPPATVAAGAVTDLSFSIDKTSQLKMTTLNRQCQAIGSVAFEMVGQKKIGQSPDVYKYDQTLTTTTAGSLTLSDLEWDTYDFIFGTTSSYSLVGTIPLSPLSVLPAADQDLNLILKSRSGNGVLVAVKDAATNLPLTGATVTLGDTTVLTSQGYFSQTDWSGGAGQQLFTDDNRFSSSDGNVETDKVGELTLRESLGQFVSAGYLISSVFDSGSTSTEYSALSWLPADQAAATGEDNVRFQLASGNDSATTTWHFVGPDGTDSSYYTVAGQAIGTMHDGDQYLRYKVYLATASSTLSPNLSDINLTYTTACTPPGQAFFDGLSTGSEALKVTRDGYTTYNSTVSVNSYWQRVEVLLQPD